MARGSSTATKIAALLSVAVGLLAQPSLAFAEENEAARSEAKPAPIPSTPTLGGHVGVAVPYLEIAKETKLVGEDRFLTIANPMGLSLHLSERWTFDMEVVVVNSVLTKSRTMLIVDPGIVYHWGVLNTGLRVAHQVGEPANIGAIPLVNKGFQVPFGVWFVEAAFPTFVKQGELSFTGALHTGIAF